MTIAQRSRARDMITAKGQTVTIAGETASTYDTSTGTTSNTAYNKTGKAVLLPLDAFRKENGLNVKAGDEQLLLAGLDSSGAALSIPPINSVVTLANGGKRTIIAVDQLDPEGAGSILYDCTVRGATA